MGRTARAAAGLCPAWHRTAHCGARYGWSNQPSATGRMMEAMQTAATLTAEEFYHLPNPIEGGKMELVCGRVVIMSPVGRPHSTTARRILTALDPFVDAHNLGELHIELGFILSRRPDSVRAPDVALMSPGQLERAGEWETFFDGPPALAAEVYSPEDRDREVRAKIREYLAAGTARVWDVRPREKTVTVYHQDGTIRERRPGDALNSGDAGFAVEGFTLSLDSLFA
ncbi:MAG: Uma2 family endonuclease [Anaerolinea sp.]|nr:Uma2 family endonuclease [Anaerolinea sp.]